MAERATIDVGAPAVPVTLNVTAVRPADEACTRFSPATVDRVQEPADAAPVASVVTDEAPIEPVPAVIAKDTETPDTPLPY